MATDSMTIRLHLRGITVDEVGVDEPDRLVVLVSATNSRTRCPFCGFKTSRVHETRTVRIRDLPVGGRRTTLCWQRRRFECENCTEVTPKSTPRSKGT